MSKKNIFLLAAGYIAGGFISSLYGKKKPEELKKELEKSREKGEGDFKVMLNNFIDTHENLLHSLKESIVTDKNKEFFNEKKEDLLKVVDIYKKQGQELTEELKIKGKGFIVEASDTLKELYEEKKDEIETLKEITPERIKEKAKEVIKEVKEKIKK